MIFWVQNEMQVKVNMVILSRTNSISFAYSTVSASFKAQADVLQHFY